MADQKKKDQEGKKTHSPGKQPGPPPGQDFREGRAVTNRFVYNQTQQHGQKAPEKKSCPSCGAENFPSSKVCVNCNAVI